MSVSIHSFFLSFKMNLAELFHENWALRDRGYRPKFCKGTKKFTFSRNSQFYGMESDLRQKLRVLDFLDKKIYKQILGVLSYATLPRMEL